MREREAAWEYATGDRPPTHATRCKSSFTAHEAAPYHAHMSICLVSAYQLCSQACRSRPGSCIAYVLHTPRTQRLCMREHHVLSIYQPSGICVRPGQAMCYLQETLEQGPAGIAVVRWYVFAWRHRYSIYTAGDFMLSLLDVHTIVSACRNDLFRDAPSIACYMSTRPQPSRSHPVSFTRQQSHASSGCHFMYKAAWLSTSSSDCYMPTYIASRRQHDIPQFPSNTLPRLRLLVVLWVDTGVSGRVLAVIPLKVYSQASRVLQKKSQPSDSQTRISRVVHLR